MRVQHHRHTTGFMQEPAVAVLPGNALRPTSGTTIRLRQRSNREDHIKKRFYRVKCSSANEPTAARKAGVLLGHAGHPQFFLGSGRC